MAQSNPDTNRLFELFIQKDDMSQFTHDYRQLTAVLGEAQSPDADPINWSSFKIDNDAELQRLCRAMNLADRIGLDVTDKKKKKKLKVKDILDMADQNQDKFYDDNSVSQEKADEILFDRTNDDEDDIIIKPSKRKHQTDKFASDDDASTNVDDDLTPEDLNEVTDRDGNVWSGLVINTDTVQHTLPAGRYLSHRCLVMVGNLRGAGGFGMGKGENAQVAMKRAFR
jgi:hypothetical protein